MPCWRPAWPNFQCGCPVVGDPGRRTRLCVSVTRTSAWRCDCCYCGRGGFSPWRLYDRPHRAGYVCSASCTAEHCAIEAGLVLLKPDISRRHLNLVMVNLARRAFRDDDSCLRLVLNAGPTRTLRLRRGLVSAQPNADLM